VGRTAVGTSSVRRCATDATSGGNGASHRSEPGGKFAGTDAELGEPESAYRLLSETDVSHAALSEPHWDKTRTQAKASDAEVLLFVQDSSELDYSRQTQTKNLGHIGNSQGRGLMLHSCLAVIPTPGNAEILGLAAQRV